MHSLLFSLAMGALLSGSAHGEVVSRSARDSTQAVGTADLDLSSRDGRALLDARIRGAARSICERLNGSNHTVAQCVVVSIDKARAQRDAQIARHVRLADAQRTGTHPIG